MKKPAKTTPTGQFDPKKVKNLQARKQVDKMERDMDRNQGRDTRMGRDGGTNRRLKR